MITLGIVVLIADCTGQEYSHVVRQEDAAARDPDRHCEPEGPNGQPGDGGGERHDGP